MYQGLTKPFFLRLKPGVVRRALDDAKVSIDQIDGIAFTRGPGMQSCLAVGAGAAKTLAAVLNKPLVGVHHMVSGRLHVLRRRLSIGLAQQGHALTASLTSDVPLEYPFLTLLISGGHTMILLATSSTSFHMLGTTVDISIGYADLDQPRPDNP